MRSLLPALTLLHLITKELSLMCHMVAPWCHHTRRTKQQTSRECHHGQLLTRVDLWGPQTWNKGSRCKWTCFQTRRRNKFNLEREQCRVFEGSGNPEERRFTLLDEVFRQFPNVPINIDIKTDDGRLISEVSNLIKRYDRQDITVWGNFSDSVTRKCYQQDPRVNLLFSMRRVLCLLVLFYTGLLPFISLNETHLEIFLPSIFLRRKTLANMAAMPLNTFVIKTVQVLLIRKILFEHLWKRGIQTYFWVLNYEEDFKMAFELGATGVMTDYPTRLTKFLEENPQYKCQ